MILTCSASLLTPGVCCHDSGCPQPATLAVLFEEGDAGQLVEHAYCPSHAETARRTAGNLMGTKPLRLHPNWTGTSR